MKIPFKYVVFLVVVTLTCIFSYQTHWLLGVYNTQKEETELHVIDAMISADISEMMIRLKGLENDSTLSGAIELSSGIMNNDTTYTRVNTIYHRQDSLLYTSKQTVFLVNKATQRVDSVNVIRSGVTEGRKKQPAKLTLSKENFADMATRIQKAMHSGLEHFSKPNIITYDSILDRQLYLYNLYRPHKVELVHFKDSILRNYSIVAHTQTTGYRPSKHAKTFTYNTDMDSMMEYRVTMEPLTAIVLKQMIGILSASLITLFILIFTFWYLVKTLWQQKTLDEMKSDFTNNITHELKTPIAIAYAANDAMLNFNASINSEKAKEYLNISQEQLQRLSGLVEQILSMSMERRESMQLKIEQLPLKEILESLASQYQLKADKPTEIRINVQPDTLCVRADRIHFYNIISNLMDNAMKYSKETVGIRIECHETDDQHTEIKFADNGIGIPVDKQKFIFDKFYRVPNGNLHEVKGYGLGLYYVKSMMDKHQGSICVKSTLGKSTVFTLLFK